MVSLPDSHVFELLARFPSTTYKIIERDFSPQNPPSTGYYSSGQNIRFNLSAAVNEFVLVDSASLDAYTTCIVPVTKDLNLERTTKTRVAWRPGPGWIGSVRETVNSGSLTTYENTDANTCNWYNVMRGALSRSPVTQRVGQGTYAASTLAGVPEGTLFPFADVTASPDADYIDIQALTKSGFCNRTKRIKGVIINQGGGGNGTSNYDICMLNGFKIYSVPLTGLGSIFQSNSIIPLGLFSTYSGQSYGLEITVAKASVALDIPAAGYDDSSPVFVVRPRISVKILKILDETVMEAVLQLYNKSQSIEVVDNMKIPMSLQLNSLKYTYHQQTLNPGAQEYTINIPCTAASLRGFAFRIVRSSYISDITTPISRAGFPLCDESTDNDQPIVYKFQVKIGSECIMESAVEQQDVTIGTNNFSCNPCLNFFQKQAKKSGHLFSLLHHSKQAQTDVTGLEDITMDGTAPLNNNLINLFSSPGYFYSMNLENINHFENQNQSSGIDMRNYGSYYIHLKVGILGSAPAGFGSVGTQLAQLQPLGVAYTLLLMNAEDVVYEVSRSGVSDITSMTL